MDKEQLTLDGQKTKSGTIPPVAIPVCELAIMWDQGDSIWETLKFFFNASLANYPGLTKSMLEKTHRQRGCGICQNSVINNLRRLNDLFLIKIISNKYGSNRSAKLYSITDKGKLVWEEHGIYKYREKTFF